jgi:hypothetical protein
VYLSGTVFACLLTAGTLYTGNAGKFKAALRDFRQGVRIAPKDPDLRKKLAACEKEVKRIRFEEALAIPVGAARASCRTVLGRWLLLQPLLPVCGWTPFRKTDRQTDRRMDGPMCGWTPRSPFVGMASLRARPTRCCFCWALQEAEIVPVSQTIDLDAMRISDSYSAGPLMEGEAPVGSLCRNLSTGSQGPCMMLLA